MAENISSEIENKGLVTYLSVSKNGYIFKEKRSYVGPKFLIVLSDGSIFESYDPPPADYLFPIKENQCDAFEPLILSSIKIPQI